MKHPDIVTLDSLAEFSDIIDVRSPAEFEEDHIPGAINCPVLSNEERITVGTLYKQVSPFEAKKVGAALVAKNIAHHLQSRFQQHGKGWKPLVYCWRGGSRSGAMTHILRQVGWPASQLQGGYKVFRTHVLGQLAELPKLFHYHVLCGETGSAKSRVLEAMARMGAQVLDLEGMACHKGSVLGVLPNVPQPSQKWFETQVWHTLRNMDPARPVWVEAESKKIGSLRVPEALFDTMTHRGSVVRLDVPVQARVEFLLRDYDYFLKDPSRLQIQLNYLRSLHGQAVIDRWHAMAQHGAWAELVEALLTQHYDPAYRKSTPRNLQGFAKAHVVHSESLSDAGIQQMASQMLALLQQQDGS
ncbi:tRNA 2-selenouridine(34) synthase MnmH [Limnobacter sp.]|uniref:tRNA 2-selenouridine(34) synthase MnmH n=1 Tax=Limnobacter sp. TaxID=2003368 RepID=UPI003518F7D2